jgi:hypothetical protein
VCCASASSPTTGVNAGWTESSARSDPRPALSQIQPPRRSHSCEPCNSSLIPGEMLRDTGVASIAASSWPEPCRRQSNSVLTSIRLVPRCCIRELFDRACGGRRATVNLRRQGCTSGERVAPNRDCSGVRYHYPAVALESFLVIFE